MNSVDDFWVILVGVGWGTDEKAIIWVLGHRNASQRRILRDTYQHLYNESLIDRLQSELSGDFRVFFSLLFSVYNPSLLFFSNLINQLSNLRNFPKILE